MARFPSIEMIDASTVHLAGLGEFLELSAAPAGSAAALHGIAEHWFRIRAEESSPRRANFRPEELVNVLPDLFIIDRLSPDLMRYRLVGTRLSASFPSDPTTRPVGYSEDSWGEHILEPLATHVAETTEPSMMLGYPPAGMGDGPAAAAVGLPLHDEGGRINMILGAGVFSSPAILRDTRPERLVKAELLP